MDIRKLKIIIWNSMLREIGTFLPCDLSTFSQIEEFRLEELSPTMQHEVILGSEIPGVLEEVRWIMKGLWLIGGEKYAGLSIFRSVAEHIDKGAIENFVLLVTHVNGTCIFRVWSESIELEVWMILSFDPKIPHSVTASNGSDACVIRVPIQSYL